MHCTPLVLYCIVSRPPCIVFNGVGIDVVVVAKEWLVVHDDGVILCGLCGRKTCPNKAINMRTGLTFFLPELSSGRFD